MTEYFISQDLIHELRSKYPLEKLRDPQISSELARDLIQLSEKYRDRLAQIIDEVASKTGIGFPHRFQRLVEIFGMSFLPQDKLWILASTPSQLRFRFQSCELSSKFRLDQCSFCSNLWRDLARRYGFRVEVIQESFQPCQFLILLE